MNDEEIKGRLKQEIKQLNRFRAHIQILKDNVGLSDEIGDELQLKINTRISQCKIGIRENEQRALNID